MNRLGPSQLMDPDGSPTGKWHWTSSNRRTGTYPVGYCADHPGHDSEDEARACFHRYLLDKITEVTWADWTGCVVCDAPTKKGLTTRQPYGHEYALCDGHRTEEKVRELDGPPGEIWGSY